MTAAEMARLQGFETGDIAWKAAATPITARGHQVGNSMTVPVLQEAMRAVLAAAGLICTWRYFCLISASKFKWILGHHLRAINSPDKPGFMSSVEAAEC